MSLDVPQSLVVIDRPMLSRLTDREREGLRMTAEGPVSDRNFGRIEECLGRGWDSRGGPRGFLYPDDVPTPDVVEACAQGAHRFSRWQGRLNAMWYLDRNAPNRDCTHRVAVFQLDDRSERVRDNAATYFLDHGGREHVGPLVAAARRSNLTHSTAVVAVAHRVMEWDHHVDRIATPFKEITTEHFFVLQFWFYDRFDPRSEGFDERVLTDPDNMRHELLELLHTRDRARWLWELNSISESAAFRRTQE